jgi:outer membrane PBP1 activator LpoA protein
MLAKNANRRGLLMLCAAALLAGCGSTPLPPDCGAPGGLCASRTPNTSVAPAQPLPPPPPEPAAPPAETFAIALPGTTAIADSPAPAMAPPVAEPIKAEPEAAPTAQTIRVGLLLPLHSEALGQAAASIKAGFMAAWERDRDNLTISVIETNEVPQDVLSAYASAQEQQDLIVGPLARNAVGTVAASPLVRKPTIALNVPENAGMLPSSMLVMGLSVEEEARQAAQWAHAEHPQSSALILTTNTPWQRRIATAFEAQWQRFGLPVTTIELGVLNGTLSLSELSALRPQVQAENPGVLLSALDTDQTRQLRAALLDPYTPGGGIAASAMANNGQAKTSDLPIYGTSALNPGGSFGAQELNGVRLLDLPWQLQPDHAAVMSYPHPPASPERKHGAADLERLYALGIDAYRVAKEIAHHPQGQFQLDGVTGRLSIQFGNGPASFERTEQPAIYRDGQPRPVSIP